VAARTAWSSRRDAPPPAPSLVVKCAVALGRRPGCRRRSRRRSHAARRDTVRPGAVFLLGDNAAAGGDSRVFGAVAVGALVGVVVGRLPSLG